VRQVHSKGQKVFKLEDNFFITINSLEQLYHKLDKPELRFKNLHSK
jgi:hypothetical protein